MKYTIKSRYSDAILYEGDGDTLRDVVIAAVKARANLGGAYLVRANLYGANLVSANLVSANLYGANLYGANLVRANLYGANLVSANLVSANLYGANLVSANLVSANLGGASLGGADLGGAYLGGAKLKDAEIIGQNAVIQISPIGSRQDTLTVFRTDKGLRLQTGCFYGDADTFLMKVMDTHGTNQHATNYRNALELAASMLEGGTP